MIKSKTKRKPAKASGSAKKVTPTVEFGLITNNPRIAELMKNPYWKRQFEMKKQEIIAGYNDIKTPKFCKTITDEKTKLTILVVSVPDEAGNAKKYNEVRITTIVGKTNYTERVRFATLERSCEYVTDFSQAQANRFANAAIRSHARNVAEHAINNIIPALQNTMRNADMSNDNKSMAIDKDKALKHYPQRAE